MSTSALIFLACVTALSALSAWIAVQARADAITARRELARHRQAHAEQAEERRTARHRPPSAPPEHDERAWLGREPLPDPEPATEELEAQELPTRAAPAVRLPRPGRIGGQP